MADPGLRWASPAIAAEAHHWSAAAAADGSDQDPWGEPYLTLESGGTQAELTALTRRPWPPVGQASDTLYLLGPNGVDDGGQGDDLVVWHGVDPLVLTYSAGPNSVDEQGRGDDILIHAPSVEPLTELDTWAIDLFDLARRPWPWVALSLLVAWLLAGPCLRSPRSPDLRVEAARSFALASGPILLLGTTGPWLTANLATRRQSFADYLASDVFVLPAGVVIFGSLSLAIYLAAMGWRVTRPPQG